MPIFYLEKALIFQEPRGVHMPEYELIQMINELRPHCFGAYLFGSIFGISSIFLSVFIGIIFIGKEI